SGCTLSLLATDHSLHNRNGCRARYELAAQTNLISARQNVEGAKRSRCVDGQGCFRDRRPRGRRVSGGAPLRSAVVPVLELREGQLRVGGSDRPVRRTAMSRTDDAAVVLDAVLDAVAVEILFVDRRTRFGS